ncbi:Hypothetical predicted protein, partial [Paramuricea clavata]
IEDDSSENSDNLESEVDNVAEEIRFIREPNGANLAFGDESTQPKPHESNTANSQSEYDARDDGDQNQELYQVVVDLLESARKARGVTVTIARHVYMLFSRYNMHSAAYKNLYLVYKLALISLVTQLVFCERTFSKLKLLRMRLRSTDVIGRSSRIVAILIMVEDKL